jgi:F0F1-type ATP synthase epsilon subunit
MGDEYTHENLQVVGIHEPDYSVERLGDGTTERHELPGVYRVGVLIDGVFAEITAFKAGLLTNSAAQARKARSDDRRQQSDDAQEAERQQAQQQQQQQQAAGSGQSSGETPPAQGQSASQ